MGIKGVEMSATSTTINTSSPSNQLRSNALLPF
jgi:hypothetical protein